MISFLRDNCDPCIWCIRKSDRQQADLKQLFEGSDDDAFFLFPIDFCSLSTRQKKEHETRRKQKIDYIHITIRWCIHPQWTDVPDRMKIDEEEANSERISTANGLDRGIVQTIVIKIVDETIDHVHEIDIQTEAILIGKAA